MNSEKQSFFGTVPCSMDERNRVYFPVCFRDKTLPGLQQAFMLVTAPDYSSITGYPADTPPLDIEAQCSIAPYAKRVSLKGDKLLIPQKMVEQAALEKGGAKTILVGCKEYFEIWSDERWKKEEPKRKKLCNEAMNQAFPRNTKT